MFFSVMSIITAVYYIGKKYNLEDIMYNIILCMVYWRV